MGPVPVPPSQPFDRYDAGNILLVGNPIPEDLSKTQLELYASTSRGFVDLTLVSCSSGHVQGDLGFCQLYRVRRRSRAINGVGAACLFVIQCLTA